jgi:hypothetical protein
MFVSCEKDGTMRWVDHSGRFGHAGVFGGFRSKDGVEQHFRGGRPISPKDVEREIQEFQIDIQLTPTEFEPIQSLITEVGKPWLAGWDEAHNKQLHDLLATVFWKHVNQYVHSPFDEQDS